MVNVYYGKQLIEKRQNIVRHLRYRNAFFHVLIIALVLSWSPFKFLAYLAPYLALMWFFLLTRSLFFLRNFSALMVVWTGLTFVYAWLTPGFVWHSAVLSLLTYSAVIFVLTVPTKPLADPALLGRMRSVARWVLLFEGTFGIVQGILAGIRRGTLDGTTGDAVAGTIRPFTLKSDFSNPMFAVNIALLLLAILPPLISERRGRLAATIAVLALILASVMHVLLFLFIALVVALIFFYPAFLMRRRPLLLVLGAVVVMSIAILLLPKNFSTLPLFIRDTFEGRTPRAQVVARVLIDLPREYPWMLMIGAGPGQFSSRAGLIGTGLYFGSPANPRDLPFLPKGMSKIFETYVLDIWLRMSLYPTVNDTSSTYKPYFSWMSVWVEWGALFFVIVIIWLCWLLWTIRRAVRGNSTYYDEAISVGASLIFLFLLGLQENYWEIPQAIFPGLLFLKVQYACLIYRSPLRR